MKPLLALIAIPLALSAPCRATGLAPLDADAMFATFIAATGASAPAP